MPKRIHGQAAVELGGDLYTIGGYSPDGGGGTLTTINRLSCTSYVCTWTTINQELKVARKYPVALPVMDYLCN